MLEARILFANTKLENKNIEMEEEVVVIVVIDIIDTHLQITSLICSLIDT